MAHGTAITASAKGRRPRRLTPALRQPTAFSAKPGGQDRLCKLCGSGFSRPGCRLAAAVGVSAPLGKVAP
jgi:hypothetical protein